MEPASGFVRRGDRAEALVQRIREMIAGAEGAELDHWTVGYRPVPEDGFSRRGNLASPAWWERG